MTAGVPGPTGAGDDPEGHGAVDVADTPALAGARQQMVERQLAGRGIRDLRVLEAMRRVPRHCFVPPSLRAEAYADHPLPIGEGQTISQPYIVARMTELLALAGPERVLEIGTGSGYQAAILAELAREVYTVEVLPALAARARRVLEALGDTTVRVRTGDGTLGWPEAAPFDRVLVAAGGPGVPPPLFDQLAEGGRLVIPTGSLSAQVLQVVDKRDGQMRVRPDCECVFVKLVGQHAWSAADGGETAPGRAGT